MRTSKFLQHHTDKHTYSLLTAAWIAYFDKVLSHTAFKWKMKMPINIEWFGWIALQKNQRNNRKNTCTDLDCGAVRMAFYGVETSFKIAVLINELNEYENWNFFASQIHGAVSHFMSINGIDRETEHRIAQYTQFNTKNTWKNAWFEQIVLFDMWKTRKRFKKMHSIQKRLKMSTSMKNNRYNKIMRDRGYPEIMWKCSKFNVKYLNLITNMTKQHN